MDACFSWGLSDLYQKLMSSVPHSPVTPLLQNLEAGDSSPVSGDYGYYFLSMALKL
jgi:hypothetical protein